MKHLFLIITSLLVLPALHAQVGIGTTNPNASAVFDITSADKGVLFPRMTQAQRTVISTPATGLLVYQTDGSTGWWYYNGSQWVRLASQPQASISYVGSVTIGDVGTGSDTTIAAVSGFVASASKTNTGLTSTITVTHNLGLSGNQSFNVTFQGLSSNPDLDNAVLKPLVFNVTANSFQVFIRETSGVGQNLRLMIKLTNY
jgi:hypothetical protein